jgi:protein SCO1/2
VGWTLGRPQHAGELARWLQAFGVVVIPDPLGGYAHNAALHVVGPDRKLVAILDPQDIAGAVQWTQDLAARRNLRVAAR